MRRTTLVLVSIGVLWGVGIGSASRVAAQAHAVPAAEPATPAAAPAAAPATAASGGATVYLKNGGFVRGELIELQPGSVARLKLADGKVRDIPWAEIDRVDDPSLPPAPPPESAPAPTLPAPEARGALAPQNAEQPGDVSSEISRLRAERDDIDNTGPAVMMIVGGGAFIIFALPGLAFLAIGEACDNNDTVESGDCTDVRGAGAVMTVIGAAGGAVAIWGLIKVGHNREKRNQLDERIRELKGNQAGLTLDLLPRREGVGLGLTLRM